MSTLERTSFEQLYTYTTKYKDNARAAEVLMSYFRGECLHMMINNQCELCGHRQKSTSK